MIRTKYYTNLYIIDDKYRMSKYQKLLLESLRTDIQKWSKSLGKNNIIYYFSPHYNDQRFVFEIQNETGFEFCYIKHKTSIISGEDVKNELIADNFYGDIKNAIEKLKENVFEDHVNELDKLIGNIKNDRKEKLQLIEIQQTKELVEDTYQDWLNNENSSSNSIVSKLIAKIIYTYRNKKDLHDLWLEKFSKINMVLDELKKIKNDK